MLKINNPPSRVRHNQNGSTLKAQVSGRLFNEKRTLTLVSVYRVLRKPVKSWNRFVVPGYRILSFAVGSAGILIFRSAYHFIVPPFILVGCIGVYTLLQVLYPFRQHTRNGVTFAVLSADVVACAFIVVSTDGLYSPFLLYALSPVLTAALFHNGKVTTIFAGLLVVVVAVSHLFNSFSPSPLSMTGLGYFWVYVIAVCLISALPYLINVNVRQHLQYNNVIQERQRLSREIHDGAAQTLTALRWQIQLLDRHLAERGIYMNEVEELEKLAEEAEQETRESLELLRNYTGDGSFLPHLKDYLEHLKRTTDINFVLDAEVNKLHLGPVAELELLRICQEALSNIKRHSGAHIVQITMKPVNNRIELHITDDGRGFDAESIYHGGAKFTGHGLTVMQERAQSVGGKCRIFSFPGQGTEIQVEMPCNGNRSR